MQEQPLLQPSSSRPSYPGRHNEVNKVKEEEVTAYRAIRKGKENQTSWYVAVLLQGQDVTNAASPPVPPLVIDASAKYPTGLFQGTWSDLGAFDECIETVARDRNGGEVARGQYCNVYVKMANDTSFFDEMLPNFIMAHERSPVLLRAQEDKRVLGVRLGLCTIADCSRDDVQALADTLTEGVAKATVSDCTTNEPKEVTKVQLVFICFLGVVIFFTVVSTIIDVCCSRRGEKPAPRTTLRILLTAFSMPRNTRVLLAVNRDRKSDSYKYRFVHGLRFFSILWIVLGHSSMALDPVISRYANVLHVTSSWIFCIISTSFLSVDTFFFLSGFLLAYNILKMKKNPVLVGTIAVLRRIIRVTVPMFFVLMCFCLLPLAATGPNTVLLFSKFHSELERHWWRLILHIRNFANANELECFSHLWYLSTDFQLFFVCVIILLLFKGRTAWLQWSFGTLSVGCCAFSAWQMSSGRYVPVIPLIVSDISTLADTFNEVYMLPTFHGATFFLGCSTLIFIESKRDIKMSAVKQAVMWAVCLTCGAVCILSRHHWNGGFTSTGDWIDVVFSFVDRLLWSSFLACLVFACANRKAGFLGCFLSWRPFVPLSRLSFGVYLVHMPLLITGYALTRERVYYSFLGVVSNALTLFVWSCMLSFCLFLVCESPTSICEKTLFVPGRVKRDSENKDSGHKTRRTVITYICPRLVVTQDQTTQASTIHLDQWCHL
ncbi:nose resistant to fluoxetine protein 6-like [Dermacentor albipictus]|uniref:nose resistant to fluoxetine protein 6-like n=1 Tax=Dermacentor albipictus TaxID=60249 RepID=UPI0038FBED0E